MPRNEDAEAAIENAIIALAKQAGSQGSSSYAEAFASAVRQLAEARAWMISAAQPHGGSASGSQKS